MKPEDQRIAIAEACGFKRIREIPTPFDRYLVGEKLVDFNGEPCWAEKPVPDFLHDLNAMHEAEIMFADQYDGKFIFEFRCALHTVLGHDGTMDVHADAAQRAKAFLKTLNLWKD